VIRHEAMPEPILLSQTICGVGSAASTLTGVKRAETQVMLTSMPAEPCYKHAIRKRAYEYYVEAGCFACGRHRL
jgi:hypothetical protein